MQLTGTLFVRFLLICLFFSISSTGCSWLKPIEIHKVDIHQGNLIDQEMINKLRLGMTKTQIQFILGTPVVTNIFNQERWDYFYSQTKSTGEEIEESLTLYFGGDGKFESMTGDYKLNNTPTDY